MFRVKISAMLTLVVVLVVAFVYFMLPSVLDGELEENAQGALSIAATSMARYERLNDFSVMARAHEVADFYRLREALTGEYEDPYDYKRHMAVLDNGLLRWKHVYEDARQANDGKPVVSLPLSARPPALPDLFFATDDKGVGVAACCDSALREWYKDNIARSHPIIMAVDDGKPRKDIWFWRWDEADAGSFYQVGIAPVMQGPEKLIGMVVVGRNITNANAKYASEQIGGHAVAYFHKKAIFASTFDKSVDAVLAEQLWGDAATIGEGAEPKTIPITIGDKAYLAAVRYSSGNASGDPRDTGFVVLTDLTEARSVARSIERGILIAGLLILVLLLVSVLIVIRSFVKPFEEIDQGIQEVIAGNKDYVFNVTGNYPFQDEMAQSLNLMTAYLQGKRMPDEEDEDTEGWSDFLVGEVTSTAMMRAVGRDGTPKVAGIPENLSSPATAEPVEDYKKRIFAEYVDARKGLGMDVDDLTMESFEVKLERHAESLREKHKAREIRFSVVVRDGKVVLKPQPIF